MTTKTAEWDHRNDTDFSLVWCHAESMDVTHLISGSVGDTLCWTKCPSCGENSIEYRPQ